MILWMKEKEKMWSRSMRIVGHLRPQPVVETSSARLMSTKICSSRSTLLNGSSVMAAQQHEMIRGSRGWGWLDKYYKRKADEAELKKKWDTEPLMPPPEGHRHKVFIEFEQEGASIGTVTFELASDLLPKTTENFINLLEGKGEPDYDGNTLCYKGSKIHQIMKSQFFVMGDILRGDGRGGFSSFGTRYFDDEGFFFRHSKRGTLSMANSGVHRNSSIFFVTMKPCPWLDGRNVPFGGVIDGFEVLDKIDQTFSIKGKALAPITVRDCGVLE